MKNVYIATKYENQEKAIELSNFLEKKGLNITCKWWENDSENILERDVQGVVDCDIFIVMGYPDLQSLAGSIFEMGIAYSHGKYILAILEEDNYHELLTECLNEKVVLSENKKV